jgi:uncharacterized protein involved in exopolysaccharide biosynthesis
MSRNVELSHTTDVVPTITRAKAVEVTRRTRKIQAAPPPSAQSYEGVAAWLRALAILRKHSLIASSFAVVVFATVAAVTFTMKPMYEPSSLIEVDPPGTQAFTLDARSGGSDNAEYLETQSKSLQTDQLALAVVRKLHLDQNPEFANPEYS